MAGRLEGRMVWARGRWKRVCPAAAPQPQPQPLGDLILVELVRKQNKMTPDSHQRACALPCPLLLAEVSVKVRPYLH